MGKVSRMLTNAWSVLILVSALSAQPPPATPGSPKQALGGGLRASSQGLSISAISVGAESFNPSRNEKVSLNYTLSRDANVTVKVFDPDLQLVRILSSATS